VQVEDVTGYASRPWWAAEEQAHLTVGNGVLGKVIVDDQGVLSVSRKYSPWQHQRKGQVQ
jgi:hypothetical protein